MILEFFKRRLAQDLTALIQSKAGE